MTYETNGLYVDDASLEHFAENFARGLHPEGKSKAKSAANDMRSTLRALKESHELLTKTWTGIPAVPEWVHWMLDNAYLAEREGRQAAVDLETGEELRFCCGGFVLLRLCETLLHAGLGRVTEDRLALFLRGFQRELILEREELRLLPSGLRTVIVRELVRLCRTMEMGGEEATAAATAERLFGTLRWLSTADLREELEEADCVERLLRADPAGVYPLMAEESREYYRMLLSHLSRQRGIPEHQAAQRVLALAQEAAEAGDGSETDARTHVGWWLLRSPLGVTSTRKQGTLYIGGNILLTLFFTLLLGFAARSGVIAALLLIPVGEVVKQLLDFTLAHSAVSRPRHVPRMALRGGITREGRTLCVVSALLTDKTCAASLVRQLENCRLVNRDAGREVGYAILADLPDSREEPYPDQESILAAAKDAIVELNQRYDGGFYLLTRPRVQNTEGIWSGWERKRGALLETMRLLRGQNSAVTVAAGDLSALAGTRFLLTLDSDSRLSPGAVRALVGAMLHPLNHPVADPQSGVIREGYGIMAPRIGVELTAAGRNDFSRLYAGQGGTDPYGGSCGELYMDLWGRGGFAGKGILDIDAYLACMGQRVPENQMLSHDAVEGAFLRAGFVGDVEVLDGWPGSVSSYFTRLERWTRGDWQNLPWLFHPGKGLPELEKWKLFDSLRRSLVPSATLAAMLAGFFLPSLGLAAVTALFSLTAELLLTMAETLLRPDADRTPRFQSALFVGVEGGFCRALLRLLLLPVEAWVCFSAAFRAMWRLFISKRNLLQWRTAAQSEGRGIALWNCCKQFWFGPLTGGALILFSPNVIGRSAGILWLLSPLTAWLLSLPRVKPTVLSTDEREYLTGCARDCFAYFDRFLTPEDHYLPPDNNQVQPPSGLGHRTSPTNIGLGLLSVLAAADLGFIPSERALFLIESCLESVENLEKWKGHLYNWYDTGSLAPLSPRYISTVDSGNFCACLIALKAGLAEYGRNDLVKKTAAIADQMSFAPLFDSRRKLFSIGYDLEQGRLTDSWYDLLSSEARLTGYLAVARGDVPREHWKRLSRAQVACGHYRGMASWTGTMFEYLMPELLLPLYRDSLLYESARFCLYVQRQRVLREGSKRPWGISESAFASLDPLMNYRYKAHGCAALALKRGMDDELVISPYSSFLALTVEPHAAIRNLHRLEKCNMRCDCGFWEALDFTSSRLYQKDPAVVRCVMAHHEGMSVVSAANALLDGIMIRRFLSDSAMGAWLWLVQEKVPLSGATLRRSMAKPSPSKPPRLLSGGWSAAGTGTDFRHPSCCLLASQTYSLLCAETGLTRALWGDISPYVPPRAPLDTGRGIDLALRLKDNLFSLLPSSAGDAYPRSWSFSTQTAEFQTVLDNLSVRCSFSLSSHESGERRDIQLTYRGNEPSEVELMLHFRPLLAKYIDYINHPAFYGLGISARVERGCLLLRRLPRGELKELWLCLAPSQQCTFDLAPGAESGRSAKPEYAGEAEYFLTEPSVCAQCTVELAPGETKAVTFALALAAEAGTALDSAARMLRETESADLPSSAATVIGMETEDVEAACAMLPFLCFPVAPARGVKQEELWRFGLSGDLPIVCAIFRADVQLDWAKKLMDRHLYLTGCGVDFDLVFLTKDGAGYQKPLQSALSGALWRSGGELLRDRRGGVHILEDSAETEAVQAAAVLVLGSGADAELPKRDTSYRTIRTGQNSLTSRPTPVRCAWGVNGEFQFQTDFSLPPRAWTNLLVNSRFGFLATDCGTGNLWYANAREQQLSPWLCQPLATTGPETLLLQSGGTLCSLFASPQGPPCRVTYLPGAAIWETQHKGASLRVTAFVPPEINARVLLVSCGGTVPQGAVLHWRMELLIGGSLDAARYCRTTFQDGVLIAENPRAMLPLPFLATTNGGIADYTFSRYSAMELRYDRSGHSGEPVFASAIPLRRTTVLVCGCESPDTLRTLAQPGAAEEALKRTLGHWGKLLSRFSLRSPELALDRIMNGWAGYQTLACRLMGRCSLYQSGGAYGFRDQLQDAVNLILFDPSLARRQIIKCCSRQYLEGDVQHWWHEGGQQGIRGVRTRCSDDLLWLPWALAEYVDRTGDLALCNELAPYLSSPSLAEGERDRYETAGTAPQRESVLRHCRRALCLVMERGVGPHGLLWIGSGDWNDGLSSVEGESVWLSWFFLLVSDRLAPLLANQGEGISVLEPFARHLTEALDRAWDGNWYLRGWYRDGKPLGSHSNHECRIDAIAQSFAILSGRADPQKAEIALEHAAALLYDQEHHLVKLFDPPFAGVEHPGYIASYGPGFRENGGQYTHGALWLILALLRSGKVDQGWELLRAILPADKSPESWKAEPYILSADVYTAAGHAGEAGWSWYTGAAGWLLRIVTEELLGLRLRNGKLHIEPHLPSHWSECSVKYRGMRIELTPGRIMVNGVPWDGTAIPLP